MPSIETLLEEVFDEVSPDLVAYFDRIEDGSFAGMEDIELNLLSVEDTIDMTWRFDDFHPIVQAFDGFVLDDPNTSNHSYLSNGPLKRGRAFSMPGGDARVVYASRSVSMDAAEAAERDEHMLSATTKGRT